LPGIGTERFPKAEYIRSFGLRYFDFVIVVVAERFREEDRQLLNELRKYNVGCVMVRNKTDLAVESELEDNDVPEQDTLAQIRQDFAERGIPDVFLISARRRLFQWEEFVKAVYQGVKRSRMNMEFIMEAIDDVCNTCLSSRIDCKYIPCNHKFVCFSCAKLLKSQY